MSTSSDLEFKGYAVHDTSKWTEFKVIDFKPKTADEYDVDIAIQYCGICGSGEFKSEKDGASLLKTDQLSEFNQ
jgi:hypothetical protein